MSQIRLLLADRDPMFLEKFSNYLNKNKKIRFILELFTDPFMFESWIASGGTADLIVVSSSFFFELSNKPENNIVILKDSPESMIPKDYKSINKFSSAENLMKEILSLCADKIPQNLYDRKESGNVHLVLYADGSDCYNPFAASIAYIKSRNSKSVFYLNLDEFSDTDCYFTGTNPKGLSEMLYYVKSQKENLFLKTEVCTSKDSNYGIDFMKGHGNPEDISLLTPNECNILLNSILSRGFYDDIVISRAFRIDEILPVLLKESTRIYVSALDYNSSIARLRKIAELLPVLTEINQLDKDISDRITFCVTAFKKQPTEINLSGYRPVWLPNPVMDNLGSFPPTIDYINTLNSILDR